MKHECCKYWLFSFDDEWINTSREAWCHLIHPRCINKSVYSGTDLVTEKQRPTLHVFMIERAVMTNQAGFTSIFIFPTGCASSSIRDKSSTCAEFNPLHHVAKQTCVNNTAFRQDLCVTGNEHCVSCNRFVSAAVWSRRTQCGTRISKQTTEEKSLGEKRTHKTPNLLSIQFHVIFFLQPSLQHSPKCVSGL